MRNKIVYYAQEKLSESSVESIKNKISKISTLTSEEIAVMQEVFESSILKKCEDFKMRNEEYKTVKYFSPSFHTIKMVFALLRELQASIMITSLTHKKNKKFLNLFFQADINGIFKSMNQEAVHKMDRKKLIVVLDAAVDLKFNEETLLKKIEEIGLFKLILSNAAQILHYGGGIEGDIIKVAEKNLGEFEKPDEISEEKLKKISLLKKAVNEIEKYKTIAKEIKCVVGENPFFNLDHVYCATVDEMFPFKITKIKKDNKDGSNE